MYTKIGAPSNNKKAKKTLPSAQSGKRMKYFQIGGDLPVKPTKSIANIPYFNPTKGEIDSTFKQAGINDSTALYNQGIRIAEQAQALKPFSNLGKDDFGYTGSMSDSRNMIDRETYLQKLKGSNPNATVGNDIASVEVNNYTTGEGRTEGKLGSVYKYRKIAPTQTGAKKRYPTLNIYGAETLNQGDYAKGRHFELVKDRPTIKFKKGGVVKNNRGQWDNPGEITQIDSSDITMKGVNYPVLGVDNLGNYQMMYPNEEYQFEGDQVTEYPFIQNKKQAKKLNQSTDFTNNNMEQGKHGTKIRGKKTKLSYAKFGSIIPTLGKGVNQLNPTGNVQLSGMAYNQVGTNSQTYLGNAAKIPVGQQPKVGSDMMGQLGGVQGIANSASNIIGGIQAVQERGKEKDRSKQFAALSGVVKQASGTRPEAVKRKYFRPEDVAIQPNEMFPTQGVGTNYLKNGGGIRLKKYQQGGQAGLAEERARLAGGPARPAGPAGLAGGLGSLIGGGDFEGSPESQLGGDIGSLAGNLILPGIGGVVGGALGSLVGGIAGGATAKEIKKNNEIAEANAQASAFQQGTQAMQTQYSGFMRSGGSLKQDYVEPSLTALKTYTMGGDLKTHWGGKAEPISYNPYLPDGGETVMFRGQSHKDGGIGMSFGKSPVEVEGGEPAVKLQDGGSGQDNLVVFGNMKIPSYGVNEIGDEKAKGKKFKSYIADLSKKEAGQNKVMEKGVQLINNTETNNPFDLLKMNSGKLMLKGSDMKLKDIAQKKQTAASVQDAILQTAEENNWDSYALSEGKIKKAKMGASLPKYQNSGDALPSNKNVFKPTIDEFDDLTNTDSLSKIGIQRLRMEDFKKQNPTFTLNQLQDKFERTTKGEKTPGKIGGVEYNKWWKENYNSKTKGKVLDSPWGKMLMNQGSSTLDKYEAVPIVDEVFTVDENPYEYPNQDYQPIETPRVTAQVTPQEEPKGKNRNDWMSSLGAIAPWLRPSNQRSLDPNQLSGEMFALASNQLDTVQAQLYNPLLQQPFDISLQDQMNANQSDFNAIQRQTQYNPSAQAALAAQKYSANSGVLGEQFRQNQAMKAGVYNSNRNTLNDAQLKNLAILDQQYTRQSQAMTNTKATAQAALSSISDKIAKNRLENRTLGVYENLYNYRYTPNGQAWNLNAPVDFQQMIRNTSNRNARNGSIVKALKRI